MHRYAESRVAASSRSLVTFTFPDRRFISAPTRSRTWLASLEARHDIRFTIGARSSSTPSGRQGSRTLISTRENRVSTAARPTVSGYLPYARYSNGPAGSRTPVSATPGRCRPVGPQARSVIPVDRMGVEPTAPILQGSVASTVHASPRFLLAEVRPGVEPGLPPYQGGVLPNHLQTAHRVSCRK